MAAGPDMGIAEPPLVPHAIYMLASQADMYV